jgi:hypothetical protein
MLWKLSCNRVSGYGQACFAYKIYSAHKLSYIAFNGQVPQGQQVRHKCKTKSCCNPAHLELGDGADQYADRQRDGTCNKKLTDDQIREIHRSKNDGVSLREKALKYKISSSTVSKIIRGKAYAELTRAH